MVSDDHGVVFVNRFSDGPLGNCSSSSPSSPSASLECNLRAALLLAANPQNTVSIVLSTEGTHFWNKGLGAVEVAGMATMMSDVPGTPVAIDGNGNDEHFATIKVDGGFSTIVVVDVKFENFDHEPVQASGGSDGGVFKLEDGSTSLALVGGVSFHSCTAGYGGAIFSGTGSLFVSHDLVFSENVAVQGQDLYSWGTTFLCDNEAPQDWVVGGEGSIVNCSSDDASDVDCSLCEVPVPVGDDDEGGGVEDDEDGGGGGGKNSGGETEIIISCLVVAGIVAGVFAVRRLRNVAYPYSSPSLVEDDRALDDYALLEGEGEGEGEGGDAKDEWRKAASSEDMMLRELEEALEEDAGPTVFVFEDVFAATDGFSERRRLKSATNVFRGELFGTGVAVKTFARDHSPTDERRCRRELAALKQFQHPNVLSFLGSAVGPRQSCVIMSFMPNGSVLDHLRGAANSAGLSWRQRLRITTGTARGIHFLHTTSDRGPLVHRAISSANILLDERFEPRLGDFAQTREIVAPAADAGGRFATPSTSYFTTSTAVASGDPHARCFLAPEHGSGLISPAIDIYAYGVLLLELIANRPAHRETGDRRFDRLVAFFGPVLSDPKRFQHALCTLQREGGGAALTDKMGTVAELVWPNFIASCLATLAGECLQMSRQGRPTAERVLRHVVEVADVVDDTEVDGGERPPTSARHDQQSRGSASRLVTGMPTVFRHEALHRATGGFLWENQVGEGASGPVYRGHLLDVAVAVKVLHTPTDGDASREEFTNELALLSQLRHDNVLGFLGFSRPHAAPAFGGGARSCLVYELMPNGSVLDWLRRDVGGRRRLTWRERLNIALGTARGLVHLHEATDPPLVHRDIKAANLLLDADLNVCIGDFGIARKSWQLSGDQTSCMTAYIVGTGPYMSPEYMTAGELSPAIDIYAFGVVLLELLADRPVLAEQEENLLLCLGPLLSGENSELLSALRGFAAVAEREEVEVWPNEVVGGLAALARGCLEQFRQSRPSANALLTQLQQIVDNNVM